MMMKIYLYGISLALCLLVWCTVRGDGAGAAAKTKKYLN